MRSSPPNSWTAAFALALIAGAALSAHRRDEYLQAARVAIEPGRVQIELDLTPGIAVAEQVLSAIDGDRSRSISPGEAEAYRGRVLSEITVDVDGTPLVLEVLDSTFPAVSAVLNGDGTMRLRVAAALPRLSSGAHRLRYRNSHRAEIGAYLVNALAPTSDRIAITAQRRDSAQRDVTVEYTLQPDASTRMLGGLVVSTTGALIWLGVWWGRRRARPPAVIRAR